VESGEGIERFFNGEVPVAAIALVWNPEKELKE